MCDASADTSGRSYLYSIPQACKLQEKGNDQRGLHKIQQETGEISISNLGKFDFSYFSTWLAAFGICRLSSPPPSPLHHVNLSRKGSAFSPADSWSWYDYSRVGSFLIQVIGTIVPQPGAEQTESSQRKWGKASTCRNIARRNILILTTKA